MKIVAYQKNSFLYRNGNLNPGGFIIKSLTKITNYFYYLLLFLKGAGLNKNCCIPKIQVL